MADATEILRDEVYTREREKQHNKSFNIQGGH